jgi:hypothetical protein
VCRPSFTARVRLVCVQADRPMQDFIAEAIREKLSRVK